MKQQVPRHTAKLVNEFTEQSLKIMKEVQLTKKE